MKLVGFIVGVIAIIITAFVGIYESLKNGKKKTNDILKNNIRNLKYGLI